MSRSFHPLLKLLKRHKIPLFSAAFAIACASILIPIGDYVLSPIVADVIESRVRADAERGFEAEKAATIAQMRETREHEALKQAIEKKDALGVFTVMSEEQSRHGFSIGLATDKEGFALARTAAPSQRGDLVYQTTAWGRGIANGSENVSFEIGSRLPFILIAAGPVRRGENIIGSVALGHNLNDEYAVKFLRKYLPADMQLAFYSKEEGVVGSTFNGENAARVVSFFNTGSDWIQKGDSGREVSIGSSRYLVVNMPLSGVESVDGGALVFYHMEQFAQNGYTAFVYVAFFFIFFAIFRRHHAGRRFTGIFLALLAALVFLFGYFVSDSIYDLRAVKVGKVPYTIYNSTLEFDPAYGVLTDSLDHRVAVKVLTGGEVINAAEVAVSFDPARVSVEEIQTENSFCAPWAFLERQIDNENGKIFVSCVAPEGEFSGITGTVFEIVFRPLVEGNVGFYFDEEKTRVLAHDGLGTDVLRFAKDSVFQIVSEKSKNSLSVFSPTHRNGGRWYRSDSPRIIWNNLGEGYRYRYHIGYSPDFPTSSEGLLSTVNTDITIRNLPEGISYFHIAPERNGVLGEFVTRKIMVDKTPPSPADIKLSESEVGEGSIVRIEFSSEDDLSGLQRSYYVRVDSAGVFLPASSPLYSAFPAGEHTITVRAFDRAGNFSDSDAEIHVLKERSAGASFLEQIFLP